MNKKLKRIKGNIKEHGDLPDIIIPASVQGNPSRGENKRTKHNIWRATGKNLPKLDEKILIYTTKKFNKLQVGYSQRDSHLGTPKTVIIRSSDHAGQKTRAWHLQTDERKMLSTENSIPRKQYQKLKCNYTFSDTQNLKECTASQHVLQLILKGVLKAEIKVNWRI